MSAALSGTIEVFLDAFESELLYLDSYNADDAAELAATLTDRLIETLCRDPRWTAIPRFDLELLRADWQRQVARQIFQQIKDTAPVREVYDAAKRAAREVLGEQTTSALPPIESSNRGAKHV
jgi:hypothetical protein